MTATEGKMTANVPKSKPITKVEPMMRAPAPAAVKPIIPSTNTVAKPMPVAKPTATAYSSSKSSSNVSIPTHAPTNGHHVKETVNVELQQENIRLQSEVTFKKQTLNLTKKLTKKLFLKKVGRDQSHFGRFGKRARFLLRKIKRH